jgi:hypothetical protein
MSDAFRHCESVNKAGFHCWLCHGHRGVHETPPSDRGRSREAGASPVWSDADPALAACGFCGGVIACDQQRRWYLKDLDTSASWSCPANAGGHWPKER